MAEHDRINYVTTLVFSATEFRLIFARERGRSKRK